MPDLSNEVVRFGAFEVNLARAELRKHGLRVRIQEQPFQLLSALLEHPGEVVSREELIRRLWPDGTVVDYDRGLNAAVTRLRQTLSDSADTPRYIETVARRGYRFLGAIEETSSPLPETSAPDRVPESVIAVVPLGPRRLLWVCVVALMLLIAASWWLVIRDRDRMSSVPTRIVPLTSGTGVDRNPSFSPDGTQVVYESDANGGPHLYIKIVGPGDPTPLTSGTGSEYGPAWSRDGRLIAFLGKSAPGEAGVYVIPPLGGVPRKVVEVVSPDFIALRKFYRRLDWTPDNRRLIVSVPKYKDGSEGLLSISIEDGTTTWLTEPGGDPLISDREPSVSPDGRTLAFARLDKTSVESVHLLPLNADSRAAGPPRRPSNSAQGASPVWTPDGKRILYTAGDAGVTFGGGMFVFDIGGGMAPRPLIALGHDVAVPAISANGSVAYSSIGINGNIWRQRIDHRGQPAGPVTPVITSSAVNFNAQYSPDGLRLVFASNRSGAREIWSADAGGNHSFQVTKFNGTFVTGSPQWSPDGKQIAFDSAVEGNFGIYVIDAQGGAPRRLTDKRMHCAIRVGRTMASGSISHLHPAAAAKFGKFPLPAAKPCR